MSAREEALRSMLLEALTARFPMSAEAANAIANAVHRAQALTPEVLRSLDGPQFANESSLAVGIACLVTGVGAMQLGLKQAPQVAAFLIEAFVDLGKVLGLGGVDGAKAYLDTQAKVLGKCGNCAGVGVLRDDTPCPECAGTGNAVETEHFVS